MDIRERLEQYRHLDGDINAIVEDIEKLDERVQRISSVLTADELKIINEFRNKLLAREFQCIQLKADIEKMISNVPDIQQQCVLRYRCINCYSYQRIANIMNYSRENIFVIHKKALKSLQLLYSDL